MERFVLFASTEIVDGIFNPANSLLTQVNKSLTIPESGHWTLFVVLVPSISVPSFFTHQQCPLSPSHCTFSKLPVSVHRGM